MDLWVIVCNSYSLTVIVTVNALLESIDVADLMTVQSFDKVIP